MPAPLPFVPHGLALVVKGCWPAWASGRPLTTGLALLAMTGLLIGFGQVVRDAVHQGDLRREATARHSAAIWRCTAMPSLRRRDACLAELNAPPPRAVLQQAPPP